MDGDNHWVHKQSSNKVSEFVYKINDRRYDQITHNTNVDSFDLKSLLGNVFFVVKTRKIKIKCCHKNILVFSI